MTELYTVTNGELTSEIKQMIESGKMDGDEAMRLLLVMVSRIQRDVGKMADRNEEILERVKEVERYNERYPSVYYMWQHRRHEIITTLIIIMLIYTFVASPWMISDLRHALLHMLGLPTDLGISVP